MYATDGQTDGQMNGQKQRMLPLPYGRGHKNNGGLYSIALATVLPAPTLRVVSIHQVAPHKR